MLLVKELEGGCGGTCVTARVMTEVGSAVGSAVDTAVVGVGGGIRVVVGTGVEGVVDGREVGAGVVAEGTFSVATAVTAVPIVEIGVTPGSGVPVWDCGREVRSPAPVTCAKYGSRRMAATPRIRIPARTKPQTGIPVPVAGPEVGFPGATAGAVSGIGAPQPVQNFWTENSSAAPHLEQNLRAMIV